VCDETNDIKTSRQVAVVNSKQKVDTSIVSKDETDSVSLVEKITKKDIQTTI